MASKQNKKYSTVAPSKNRFAEALHTIGHRFPLFSVFDDFLTMSIAACTQNLQSKKSWYEEEYLQIIAKYKDSELRHEFSKAFAYLVIEMEERVGSSLGNDVMGEFHEQHFSNERNGQYFTPYPICQFLASITNAKVDDPADEIKKPLKIIDPTCGSGRMLLASHQVNGPGHEYYGIDIDRTCVKMTALNLFLNGVWNGEVLCANALMPDDFVIAYRTSFLPLGIFKIEVKEHSKLWHLHQSSFEIKESKQKGADIILDPTPFTERKNNDATQLDLF
ncbi:MAG: SAM-dependent methyltransferase [Segetibacter sp.]|nr:SAM-dependent methyltransferase [Segetibacter sp.]